MEMANIHLSFRLPLDKLMWMYEPLRQYYAKSGYLRA